MSDAAALAVEGVSHAYAGREVLRDVGFTLEAGRTLAVVGESGAGKSTLSRLVAGLELPTSGRVRVAGVAPTVRYGAVSPVQMVFQHPTEALNRFLSVGASVAEGLRRLPRRERAAYVAALLEQVGIDPSRARERPKTFSGGQLQRIVTARALAAEPKLLLCDEPTSALDVSVQAQIVNLLLALQERNGFACLLVTHDLGVARVLADDVLVLRDGEMVELAPADDFFAGPSTPYAQELLRTTAEQMLVRERA
ncbi:MAG TPA: ATP-binding cassette domain-containing protein [Conexibacter sp.]|jgi:ABC-type dipeptide/oligopeptide/nickel transport system ATPase subunit|nr:ATP-binding cassette domain-containing protein [Conexibacter sp.]